MSDDWNTVTVIGNRTGGNKGGMSKERQVNLARRQGAGVSTEQKYGGGGNKQGRYIQALLSVTPALLCHKDTAQGTLYGIRAPIIDSCASYAIKNQRGASKAPSRD